jgi:hypothetical protein
MDAHAALCPIQVSRFSAANGSMHAWGLIRFWQRCSQRVLDSIIGNQDLQEFAQLSLRSISGPVSSLAGTIETARERRYWQCFRGYEIWKAVLYVFV